MALNDSTTAIAPGRLLSGLSVSDDVSSDHALVLLGGDLCPIGRPESLILAGRSAELWGGLPAIVSKHNFFIANLECPLTRSKAAIAKSGPHLSVDPVCAESIKAAGIDALALANNHIMDRGNDGLRDTLDACAGAGLVTFGAGMNPRCATAPLYANLPGVRLAAIGICENESSTSSVSGPGANGLNLAANYLQIQEAKAEGEFVLVLFHGGHEYYPLPSPRMVERCRFFADVGAHAIVCCHTHVPGGFEIYKGVPIVYGTGNFLFDWPARKPKEWYRGYLVSLGARKGRTVSLSLIPFEQCAGGAGIRVLGESDAIEFLGEVGRLTAIIADPDRLQAEWVAFVEQMRVRYLSGALNFNRVERWLYRSGLWPFWRSSRSDLPKILNQISCEAHRDLTMEVLRREVGKGQGSSAS